MFLSSNLSRSPVIPHFEVDNCDMYFHSINLTVLSIKVGQVQSDADVSLLTLLSSIHVYYSTFNLPLENQKKIYQVLLSIIEIEPFQKVDRI